jgi:alkanesulfonate monooxygenase SsuD/methylene tetrahydromethanopterin reductase-like flavin-dependent oxidoreductase (luciferase family)
VRIGYAIDLHATAANSKEVEWERLREQVTLAEYAGLDIVVVADHLLYPAGAASAYATKDAAVGVWESTTMAAAMLAATTTIDVGHSMLNTPYRVPALVANVAATLDAIGGGRYSLGIGSGNSLDYAEMGVDADRRIERFAETLHIVHGLLKEGRADVVGEHVRAEGAELVLRGPRPDGPPIVVAAGGPRSMELAVRFGDAWNGEFAFDADHTALRQKLADLDRICEHNDRDPSSLRRTVDGAVDPLDLKGKRDATRKVLHGLAELGIDEVRCYPETAGTHESRMRAITALAVLRADF